MLCNAIPLHTIAIDSNSNFQVIQSHLSLMSVRQTSQVSGWHRPGCLLQSSGGPRAGGGGRGVPLSTRIESASSLPTAAFLPGGVGGPGGACSASGLPALACALPVRLLPGPGWRMASAGLQAANSSRQAKSPAAKDGLLLPLRASAMQRAVGLWNADAKEACLRVFRPSASAQPPWHTASVSSCVANHDRDCCRRYKGQEKRWPCCVAPVCVSLDGAARLKTAGDNKILQTNVRCTIETANFCFLCWLTCTVHVIDSIWYENCNPLLRRRAASALVKARIEN